MELAAQAINTGLQRVTETVFPSARGLRVKSLAPRYYTEILSNVPLQMCLYFNVYFYPFWFIGITMMQAAKTNTGRDGNILLPIIILVTMSLIEPVRLYLGFDGNLREKVPSLAGFWLLSIIMQFPLNLYVMVAQEFTIAPFERTLQGILFALLVPQIILGYRTIQVFISAQAIRFKLNQYQMRDEDGNTVDSNRRLFT
eukprot:Colp12_sorted_trinity150504_noHs@22961